MMLRRTYITGKTFIIASTWIVASLLSILFPVTFAATLCLLAASIIILLYDITRLPKGDEWTVQVQVPSHTHLQTTLSFPVRLELQDELSRGLQFLCHTLPFPLVHWDSAYVRLTGFSEEAVDGLHGSLRAAPWKLGYGTLSEIQVDCISPLGFWRRCFRYQKPFGSFRVMPHEEPIPEHEFSRMIRLSRLLSQSQKVLVRSHSEDQFRAVREFRYPDSIRRIDHKKSAKYSRLMTRLYDSFHSHHLILALDLGRTSSGVIAHSSKHDFYLSTLLSLSKLALGAGDIVSVLAFSDSLHWSVRGANRIQSFEPIFRGDPALSPKNTGTRYDLLPSYVRQVETKRSVIILLTDFTHPGTQAALLRTCQVLSQKHVVLLLSLLDGSFDLHTALQQEDLTKASESEMKRLLYLYWLEQQVQLFSRRVSATGASALKISERHWLSGCRRVYSAVRASLSA